MVTRTSDQLVTMLCLIHRCTVPNVRQCSTNSKALQGKASLKHPSIKKSAIKRPKRGPKIPLREQSRMARKLGVELAEGLGIDLEQRVKEMDQKILEHIPPSETENKFATTEVVQYVSLLLINSL